MLGFCRGVKKLSAAALLLLAACTVMDNSDRTLPELVNHMAAHAGGVFSGGVFVPPVKASAGVSMTVEGRDVFFYKYDLTLKKQKAKLKQIVKSKKLYINGIPFPAAVNGCFVMIGHDSNLKKKELLEAFNSF